MVCEEIVIDSDGRSTLIRSGHQINPIMLDFYSQALKRKKVCLYQAYFFTVFPASTETGISEALSLEKNIEFICKISLSLGTKSYRVYGKSFMFVD